MSNSSKLDLSDDEELKLEIIKERTESGCTLYEAVLKLLHRFEDSVQEKLNDRERHKFLVHVYEKLGLTFEV